MAASDHLSRPQFRSQGASWLPLREGTMPAHTDLAVRRSDTRPLKTITLGVPSGVQGRFNGNGGVD